jgi:hypothetical protein
MPLKYYIVKVLIVKEYADRNVNKEKICWQSPYYRTVQTQFILARKIGNYKLKMILGICGVWLTVPMPQADLV